MVRITKNPRRVRNQSELTHPEPVLTEPAPSSAQQKKISRVTVILSVLLLLAAGATGFLYYRYVYQAPDAVNEREVSSLLDEIGRFLILPEDEIPTLATVKDRDKLIDQMFFQKAENDDKVLIYTEAGKAILYRPSLKKIVDMTMINVNGSQSSEVQSGGDALPESKPSQPPAVVSPAQPASLRVALYNGTTRVGVTNTAEERLKAEYPDLAIAAKEKATRSDYSKTLVVDVSGAQTSVAANFATFLGGEVSSLPAGETLPDDTDLLIIVGGK